MNFSSILALSEAANGYYGAGPAYDFHPHLSLDETVDAFCLSLHESAGEFIHQNNVHNESLFEATMHAAYTGSTDRIDYIMEGVFEDLKATVKKYFEKLKKWIKSIIAKLKIQIDKLTKSGTQLWEKYKNSNLITRDFKGLVYNGFDYITNDKSVFKTAPTSESDINDLLTEAIQDANGSADGINTHRFGAPGDVSKVADSIVNALKVNGFDDDDTYKSEAVEFVDKLKDIPTDEIELRAAERLIQGVSLTKGSYKNDIMKHVQGGIEKKEIKYGTGIFNATKLGEILSKTTKDELNKISDEYQKTLDGIDKIQKNIEKTVEKLEKDKDKIKDYVEGGKNNGNYKSQQEVTRDRLMRGTAIDYIKTYISKFNSVITAINNIKAVRTTFYKSRFAQCTGMFGKMLSYKEKKDNNSVDFDTAEFELDI